MLPQRRPALARIASCVTSLSMQRSSIGCAHSASTITLSGLSPAIANMPSRKSTPFASFALWSKPLGPYRHPRPFDHPRESPSSEHSSALPSTSRTLSGCRLSRPSQRSVRNQHVPCRGRACLTRLAVLLDVDLVARTGGMRVLLGVLSDGPEELAPTLVQTFLYLLDMPATRGYLNPGTDLEVRLPAEDRRAPISSETADAVFVCMFAGCAVWDHRRLRQRRGAP